MVFTRRKVLKTGLSTVCSAIIASAPKFAHAELAVGQMKLDVVSDGSLTLPGGFIFDPMPKDELGPILQKYNQSPDVLTPPCNVTLLRSGDRAILFDVGSGPDFAPNSGVLVDSLANIGVAPEDITDIVFTHAHPDHIWGVLDDFDDPLFPQATYMIGKSEWDYWMNPNTVDTIGDGRVSFAVGAQRRLAAIEDSTAFFNDNEEIIPGVLARQSYGHTPGHMSFEVRSGTESTMIIGDSIGNHHVAFARPDWNSGSDQDQEAAAKTRVSLLDQLASEQMRIVGYHLTGNGVGRVEKTDDNYRFVSGE